MKSADHLSKEIYQLRQELQAKLQNNILLEQTVQAKIRTLKILTMIVFGFIAISCIFLITIQLDAQHYQTVIKNYTEEAEGYKKLAQQTQEQQAQFQQNIQDMNSQLNIKLAVMAQNMSNMQEQAHKMQEQADVMKEQAKVISQWKPEIAQQQAQTIEQLQSAYQKIALDQKATVDTLAQCNQELATFKQQLAELTLLIQKASSIVPKTTMIQINDPREIDKLYTECRIGREIIDVYLQCQKNSINPKEYLQIKQKLIVSISQNIASQELYNALLAEPLNLDQIETLYPNQYKHLLIPFYNEILSQRAAKPDKIRYTNFIPGHQVVPNKDTINVGKVD